jgi:hypothetical protein
VCRSSGCYDDIIRFLVRAGADTVAFYRDREMKALLGKYSGDFNKAFFPSAAKPLVCCSAGLVTWRRKALVQVIEGDRAYVHFHTDHSVVFWGYRFTATAVMPSVVSTDVRVRGAIAILAGVSREMA